MSLGRRRRNRRPYSPKGVRKERREKKIVVATILSNDDLAALINMQEPQHSVSVQPPLCWTPLSGRVQVSEPGHKTWAVYPRRP